MSCCRNFVCRDEFVPKPCQPGGHYKICTAFDFCSCPLMANTSLDINCPVGPGWKISDANYKIIENSAAAGSIQFGDTADPDGFFTVADMMADPVGQVVWGAGAYLPAGRRYSTNDRLILTPSADIMTGILSICFTLEILDHAESAALINSVANVA